MTGAVGMALANWAEPHWAREVEMHMRAITGAPYAIAFASCAAAIHATLAAHGAGPGTRVWTPALGFAGTVTGAVHLGARLEFTDCDPGTLTMAGRRWNVGLVLPVDLHGVPWIPPPMLNPGLPVVTDSCQALGTTTAGIHGGGTGTHCWSFSSAKIVSAPDGGAVTTDSTALCEALRSLRDYGTTGDGPRANRPVTRRHGHNWRPSELSMALAAVQFPELPARAHRAATAATAIHTVCDMAGIWHQSAPAHTRPAWQLIRIGGARWPRLRRAVEAAGVPTFTWGVIPLHRQPAYGTGPGLPVTEDAAARTFCLGSEACPPWTWTDDEIGAACRAVLEAAEVAHA